MSAAPETAIVAALEQEVRGLVAGWEKLRLGGMPAFRRRGTLVVCGGAGSRAARKAAEAALAQGRPRMLISAGLAGALSPDLGVGCVLSPAAVIDAESGKRFACVSGEGILVTAPALSGPEEKQRLRTVTGGDIVDMEGSAVAEVAQAQGVPFCAIKAVSDDCCTDVRPLAPFLGECGFDAGAFTLHAFLRPQLWGFTLRTWRDSSRAAAALAAALRARIALEIEISTAPVPVGRMR